MTMKAIILAGGKGTRLPHSAKNIPKALIEVGGKPILQHQLGLLEKHCFNDIRLALGYRAEQIIRYLNGNYEYVVEPEPLGTGGAIKFSSQDLREPFMVLNGDVICDVDLQAFAKANQKNTNSIIISYHSNNTDYGLVEVDEEGKIKSFTEKPQEPKNGYVNVGIYILQPEIIASHPVDAFSIEYDLFPCLAAQGALHSFKYNGKWTDLGTEERVKKFNK